MFRVAENDLLVWRNNTNRKPLLLRGARQVGKSFIVEKFARENFENTIIINFEFDEKLKTPFISSLDPHKIIMELCAILKVDIWPGKTLLFLDEIQECPAAIASLRYFKEKMPELHVIGAGSLLEFALNSQDFHKPVGRVQSLYLRPLTFYEFLIALGEEKLIAFIESADLTQMLSIGLHTVLLERVREYFLVGGMPEAVEFYRQNKQLRTVEIIQGTLLEYYKKDFFKYPKKINVALASKLFSRAPLFIGRKFRFSEMDPDVQARDQRPVLDALYQAGVLIPLVHSSAAGIPLNATMNEKIFKLLFLDLGLVQHAAHVPIELLLREDLNFINNGALAEQFVGQELLAYGRNYEQGELYYWQREKVGSNAEVDYVILIDDQIIPIEVKAGKTGRLKSLKVFMDEKKTKVGVKISTSNLSYDRGVLSVPFYMIKELPRLIRSLVDLEF